MQSSFCPALGRVMSEFRDEVSRQLEDQAVQQKELAYRAGFKPSYLSRVLSGRHNVTLDTFLRIAEAIGLNVQISYLKDSRRKSVKIIVNCLWLTLKSDILLQAAGINFCGVKGSPWQESAVHWRQLCR